MFDYNDLDIFYPCQLICQGSSHNAAMRMSESQNVIPDAKFNLHTISNVLIAYARLQKS
jgi:hypothetical protein